MRAMARFALVAFLGMGVFALQPRWVVGQETAVERALAHMRRFQLRTVGDSKESATQIIPLVETPALSFDDPARD